MEPVLTAAEMRQADEAAQATVGLETLIARAGFAVATEAIRVLGGAYGRRVVVVAGRGHNGDDGRVAAAHLRRRGATVEVVAPGEHRVAELVADLVVDAAFGTGFHGRFDPPAIAAGVPVLAVDLASGLDADLGTSAGALFCTTTVTFQARKPGLLLNEGPARSGRVVVADIGLPLVPVRQHLVEDADLALVPPRRRSGHKWDAAVYVVAGSPGMYGASELVASAALRAGSGMVRLASPGGRPPVPLVVEAVGRELPAGDFGDALLADLERERCVVIGPGLGSHPATTAAVRRVLERAAVPIVLDADGLNALGRVDEVAELLASRSAPLVLTPHEGEFARLAGAAPGEDRVGDVRDLARRAHAFVLLKGAPTIVAAPDGEVRLVASGSSQLSTAGTGDVLSGVIGALVARGVAPLDAAALAAHVHGRAGRSAPGILVAGDLPGRIAALLGANES